MTANEIIDALGGNRDVAALFGVTTSAVSNWRAFGRFPARLHYRLSKACETKGIALDEHLLLPPERPDTSSAIAPLPPGSDPDYAPEPPPPAPGGRTVRERAA